MFKPKKPLIFVYKTEDGQAIDLTQSTFTEYHPVEYSVGDGQPWLMLDAPCDFERNIEKHYKAFYMGFWELKNGTACRIFFQPEPDVALGHSNFFGIIVKTSLGYSAQPDDIWIVNGKSAFETPMSAIMNPNTAEVIISQSNHDFRSFRGGGNVYIDGGRAYCRLVGDLNGIKHGLVECVVDDTPYDGDRPDVDFWWKPNN